MSLSENQKTKLILLLLLLISSLFILGCSSHGKQDEEDVRYEFCPGKYFWSAGESHNMIYYAVNQSSVSGSVKDPNGTVINGSGFKGPVNVSDDNGGMWVADGFVEEKNASSYAFIEGTYTLGFSIKSGNYETKRDMNWEGFTTWKNQPTFNTSSVNSPSRLLYIESAEINTDANTANYEIRYRIKVYVGGNLSVSQLFGQSKAIDQSKFVNQLTYTLPKVGTSIQLVPVLVCEMYQNGKIQKILYYPGTAFTYNP